VFLVIDRILHFLDGLRFLPFIRGYSRRSFISWILEHREDSGDWAGIFPPMHLGLLALTLEGFQVTDPPIAKGLEAVERFAWEDHQGRRIQACVSPTWYTILMSIALCGASFTSFPPSSHTEKCKKLQNATDWIQNRQLTTQPYGDWRVYSPNKAAQGGGFSFEYFNTWYPDVDDTAAAIIAFLKHASSSSSSQTAWAVMALLPYSNLEPDVGIAIEHGVNYLIKAQTTQEEEGSESGSGAATWEETRYTGTGFPNFFYIGYALYSHYFR
jgi:squalene-hopene/tetraprenyl-beta-curcumene cyclase